MAATLSDVREDGSDAATHWPEILRLLRAARLVRGERRNKQVFYEADDEHVRHMLADMLAHSSEEEAG